ncbi:MULTISPECIES: hypothetical protein [unclassified Variovorax]|uniref:hypothetical protein n=1 Tax=unclassified Variovorax TaxID=663243 RepID=UPI001315C35C|nr:MULTISPECIES: hypothetical protein [unclassified Variovorax]VTU42880.1 Type II secretory pathway, ATPase PulE/Tfp pilus assembly pathway, ATPase PilB [Variovorax sp. PBL-H6]VTU43611.1 Type II secretory pathway, ATPase PulE/Tfp pilus assembly pathway, ATPase PilB [Variovorax sp. SRS16]VTU43673.1 Type II secretory pathway, ATPase PulE/Tfp pilus assembly pathway, ATPase PilB [Variovorax sp. PBL-E5]
MPNPQNDSLHLFAHQVSAQLFARCRVNVSIADVLDMVESAVYASEGSGRPAQPQQAPNPAQAPAHLATTSAAETLVRNALQGGQTYILEQSEGTARLALLDPTIRSGIRQLNISAPGDVAKALRDLLGVELEQDNQVSRVVALSDGTEVFLTVRRFDASQQDRDADGYEISALPAKKPALSIYDLGITQVDRWMDAAEQSDGLCLVHGTGIRTTLRATADELAEQGREVIWVDKADDGAALARMDADVYVFSRPLRDAKHLQMVVELAEQGYIVLASLRAGSAKEIVNQFYRAGVPAERLGDILNATLLQVLVDQAAEDDGSPFSREDLAPTVLSEFIGYDDARDLEALMSGDLHVRFIAIDAAEKLRADEITEEAARSVAGDLLDVYL